MGYGRAVSLTAVGDTVNVASRLESLTKELDVQLVLSNLLATWAAAELPAAVPHEVAVRGRRDPLRVLAVADAALLPAGVRR
jgi:adenylate cyclase